MITLRVGRIVLCSMAGLALVSCQSFGPSRRDISRTASVPDAGGQGMLPIKVVEVGRDASFRLPPARLTPAFSEVLQGAAPIGTTVDVGDALEITIWEAPPATLFGGGMADTRILDTQGIAPADFIVLGTIEGRKNHKLLLSVWENILSATRSDPKASSIPRLVIVGRRGWQADDVFAMLDRHDFGGHVVEAGPVPDAQLARMLQNARALLFPSFAEGYGMPLIEALAAGVPVIASDLPVFHEVGQGVPDLLPASGEEMWRAAIIDYARPTSVARASQIARMKNLRVPTWSDHFARLDAFIAKLQSSKNW